MSSKGDKVYFALTAFGETRFAGDWAGDPRCAVTKQGLLNRIRAGWDAEKAITTPYEPERLNGWESLTSFEIACVDARSRMTPTEAAALLGVKRENLWQAIDRARRKLALPKSSDVIAAYAERQKGLEKPKKRKRQ